MTTGTTEHVYQYVKQYKVTHGGNSPSYREVMAGTGIKSTYVVKYHIDKLIQAGRIAPTEGRKRALILIE